jgi:hypothetical protein
MESDQWSGEEEEATGAGQLLRGGWAFLFPEKNKPG